MAEKEREKERDSMKGVGSGQCSSSSSSLSSWYICIFRVKFNAFSPKEMWYLYVYISCKVFVSIVVIVVGGGGGGGYDDDDNVEDYNKLMMKGNWYDRKETRKRERERER